MTSQESFSQQFLQETVNVISSIDVLQIEAVISALVELRDRGGRLFILGVGGSAGHAGHAVNDFRKICGIESYAPTDNVSELTARTNDEGWDTVFAEWLKVSRLTPLDAVLVFSVGGGDIERNISPNLVKAVNLAVHIGAAVLGIVGKDGGYVAKTSDTCIVIPPLFESRITPHTEGICAILWHLLVSHPRLQIKETMWESAVKNNR